MPRWVDHDPAFVRRRYNRLAPFYPLLEWLWLPRGIRAAAVHRLQLQPGDRVLEVGCGTGSNFPLLLQAVGTAGRVYGVDFTEEMLARAQALCVQRHWHNVTLLRSEATTYSLPEPVDGVLFSLSYSTMPQHRAALRHSWAQLRPGGHLVVMDAKTPPGLLGKLAHPLLVWVSRATVLGNPDVRPWEELHTLTEPVDLEERFYDSYYICHARKPAEERS